VIEEKSLVNNKESLTPEKVLFAKNAIKKIVKPLASTLSFIEVKVSQADLEAIMAIASHTFDGATFDGRITPFGVRVSISQKINFQLGESYLNFHCFFIPSFDQIELDNCALGDLPIPGVLIRLFVHLGVSTLFGSDVNDTIFELVDNAIINNNEITLTANKKADLKTQVNDSLKGFGTVIKAVSLTKSIDAKLVELYIHEIKSFDPTQKSLAYYIGQTFQLVKTRVTSNGDAENEGTAALWAIIIVYGNANFGKYIGVEYDTSDRLLISATLRGRQDLRLHFLYSAFLEQMGQVKVANRIGELKELLDTSTNGSGYSFPDLAADKAGAILSEKLGESNEIAFKIIEKIANTNDENLFFPFIHDLPEGYNLSEFKQIIGSVNSKTYKKLENEIDKRIRNLAVFSSVNNSQINNIGLFSKERSSNEQGEWLTVDTHIHSNYSDGEQTISTIANKAVKYGCDAIAITDHSDYTLLKVASPEYFNEIKLAKIQQPSLTVIPALEWNIPPFMGREHVSLFLPEHPDIQRNMSIFRDRYDSFSRRTERLISAEESLNWLYKNTTYNNVHPAIIYNHPSRKDVQKTENKHDIIEWNQYHNLVVGFSGSPGHQKNRYDDNGSYNIIQKTINGWDPSVAIIGGEWDQLLQEGYFVSAARAPSDFHNVKMDYWPCQFSTTHLYALKNTHNNIIKAFQSGNTWAQHGKVVKSLDFTVSSNSSSQVAAIGGKILIPLYEKVTVELQVSLNELDWQGVITSLDEVELIVINEDNITSYQFDPLTVEKDKHFIFKFEHVMTNKKTIFRWRGRSDQPEQHKYMFYTNPIYVISK